MDTNFEEIYSKYYKSVYRYMITITKELNIAEEITQETFFKALRNIDKYEQNKKMLTWLCEIAKNTYFSEYKKNKKYKTLDENEVDDEATIIDRVIDNEDNKEILKVLHNLEEPYKEVFTLRVYGELSFRQIGEIFDKNENWARVTYYRSKLKIREKLR